jgi:ubiquinone/menaquinone biosynthesis C-methylase UbiE
LQTSSRELWSEAQKKLIPQKVAEFPFLNFSGGMKVLDIGCGSGSDLVYLRHRFGLECYGADIALSGIMEIKGEGVFCVLADASHLPFRSNLFDVVYSFGTIEHTQETYESVRESFRVLRSGGQVLHTVPNMFSLHTLLARPLLKLLRKWLLGLEYSFTLKEFHRMFWDAGFMSIKYKLIPFDIQVKSRQFSSIEGFVRSFKIFDNVISNIVPFWGFFVAMNGAKPKEEGIRTE